MSLNKGYQGARQHGKASEGKGEGASTEKKKKKAREKVERIKKMRLQ